MCCSLTTSPSSATLANDVALSLSTVDGTGTMPCLDPLSYCLAIVVVVIAIATNGGGDYEPLYMPINFPTGSADGAETCASVVVNSDNLVETEEHFMVVLALRASGTSLRLGTNATTIALIDSDGNNIANNYYFHSSFSFTFHLQLQCLRYLQWQLLLKVTQLSQYVSP